MVVALKACYESDIFLTTYLGNILNHVYWFQIGTNENTEVKLLKNGMEVICICFSRKSETANIYTYLRLYLTFIIVFK